MRRTKDAANRTRRQIIDAARQVFRDRGVSRASFDDVAAVAGVSRGAIYWHFTSKAEILLAIQEQGFQPLSDAICCHFDTQEGSAADPLGNLESLLRESFRMIREREDVCQTLEILMFHCECQPELAQPRAEFLELGAVLLNALTRIYTQAQASGHMRCRLAPHVLATDTFAFLHGLLRILLLAPRSHMSFEQALAAIAAHIVLRRG